MAVNNASPKRGKVVDIPANAPTIGTATDAELSSGAVTVAYTAGSTATGGPISSYTAVSNPGSIVGTGTTSPITVSGLTLDTSYTFTVAAVNATGTSEYSAASNSATPTYQQFLLAKGSISPYIKVFAWSDATGIGTALPDPAVPPTTGDGGAVFNKARSAIAVQDWISGRLIAFQFTPAGIGARYSAPVGYTGYGYTSDFNNDDTALVSVSDTTPYVFAFPWDNSTGFGTKYANPGTLPTGAGQGVAFSPDGATIAVSHHTSPWLTTYPFASGFGTKYSNPATLPTSQGKKVRFSPDGNTLVMTSTTTPYISAYPWSSGFGTKYANPATLPSGGGNFISWSPDGTDLAVTSEASPYILVYQWSSGFGTKYANPASLPAQQTYSVTWSNNGSALVTATYLTPFINAWAWSSGFGTKYADPTWTIGYPPTIQIQ